MDLKLNTVTAAVAFVAVVAFGPASLFVLPEVTPMAPMLPETILMMVMPSMAIFGLITFAIGVAHGQHRATA